ncbi:hypothetical protein PSI19_08875 [Xenorhabdus khoisanae]|nr:hypothetical protein [Xenorhabdus khoisanae]
MLFPHFLHSFYCKAMSFIQAKKTDNAPLHTTQEIIAKCYLLRLSTEQ